MEVVCWRQNMIKSLQRNFILIAMGSLLAVLVVVLGGLNGMHLYQVEQRAEGVLWLLATYDGEFPEDQKAKRFLEQIPGVEEEEEVFLQDRRYKNYQEMSFWRQLFRAEPHISAETKFSTRYFYVKKDTTGEWTEVNLDHIAAVTETQAKQYIAEVEQKGEESGYLGQYRYLNVQKDGGTLLLFLDCTTQIESVQSFLYLSCGLALFVFLVVFVLVAVLSRKAIAPVIENIEKQKQFIIDAGHELKTPLAIIAANADVLALYHGKEEWVESIQHQVIRLNNLVHSLLQLARMEELVSIQKEIFDFSALVEETLKSFSVLAEQKGVDYDLSIEPKIMLSGEKVNLQQLISVLGDNAIKYVSPQGTIRVTLRKRGRFVQFEIYNSCDILPEGSLDLLFDRFRRTDQSRARESGGYGIGLAVAKATVERYHGKINAERKENGICFDVKLPCV